MKYNFFEKILISNSNILKHQNILEINDNNVIQNYLNNFEYKCDFVSSNNLNLLLENDCRNFYDIVFCPYIFYKKYIKNREDILKILNIIMYNNSSLIFSIANLNSIILDKKHQIYYDIGNEIKKSKITIHNNNYYKVIIYNNFLKKTKEIWDINMIKHPLKMFYDFNQENNFYNWKIHDLSSIKYKNKIIYVIDFNRKVY